MNSKKVNEHLRADDVDWSELFEMMQSCQEGGRQLLLEKLITDPDAIASSIT